MNMILRFRRRAAGLSAAELATRAGSKEMRVFAFERERYPPRRDEALRIAAVLGADAWEIWPDLFNNGETPCVPN